MRPTVSEFEALQSIFLKSIRFCTKQKIAFAATFLKLKFSKYCKQYELNWTLGRSTSKALPNLEF